jgi:hypothetical protein
MFLPHFFPADPVGLSGYANLPWGSVYGLGWFAATLFVDPRLRAAALFGSLIWPIIVTCVLFYVGRRMWIRLNNRSRKVAVTVFLLLLCVDVPLELAFRGPLDYLPLYYKFMFIVY